MKATREQVLAMAREACPFTTEVWPEDEWHFTAADLEAFAHKLQQFTLDQLRAQDGWQLVPMEPTASQLDVAVSFALNVKLCNDYNWSAYMRDVYARMISAAPKPDPERKHEIVPTLAEPSEYAKAFQDMITHGCSFMKDGMRIPPEDVIEPAEPDCECGAVATVGRSAAAAP